MFATTRTVLYYRRSLPSRRRTFESAWSAVIPHGRQEEDSPTMNLPPLIRLVSTSSTSSSKDSNVTSSSVSDQLREKIDARKEQLQQTVHDYRTKTNQKLKAFKDHPRESAMEGAQTMSGMIRSYGPVFIGTYFGIYVVTLSSLFLGVETGVLDPIAIFGTNVQADSTVEFVINYLKSHTITEPVAPWLEKNPQFANLAVSWLALKLTEPVRLGLAVFATPRLARYFGYAPKKRDPPANNKESPDDDTKQDAAASSSSSKL